MPLCEFIVNEGPHQGETVEQWVDADNAPPFGSVLEVEFPGDGRFKCTRVIPPLSRPIVSDVRFVSQQLGQWEPGADYYIMDENDEYYGQPCFDGTGKNSGGVQRFMDEHARLTGEELEYGDR